MIDYKDLTGQEVKFLKESNFIEKEYSEEALQDAIHSWNFAKKHKHHKINIDYILKIHFELMNKLDSKIAGKIREVDVWVANRKCLNSKEIKKTLEFWCNGWAKEKSEEGIKEAHVKFEKIHPFEDGNGRVGRILMNIQRLNAGLLILIICEGEEQYEYYKWFEEDGKNM